MNGSSDDTGGRGGWGALKQNVLNSGESKGCFVVTIELAHSSL